MSTESKGYIQASCGHRLTHSDGIDGMGFPTITLGDDCDYDGVHRCFFYGTACKACYGEMKSSGRLATLLEAEAWVEDGTLPERMKTRETVED